jgi:hypothetical protein
MLRIDARFRPHAFVDRYARFRVCQFGRDSIYEVREILAPAGIEHTARIGVRVDVEDGLLPEFVRVRFGPFGRAQETGLFRVPTRIDERALRAPTLRGQRAESFCLFEQRDLAGQRICGAEHPAVMMIAAHDPLIGPGRALHHRDDVVDRLETPVGFDREMHECLAGPHVIGDRQAAAPPLRHNVAAE